MSFSTSLKLGSPSQPQSLRRETISYPFFGVISVVVGYYFAITLMPKDFHAQGALMASGIVMSIGLALAPLLAATERPKSLIRAENVVAMAPIYWILLDIIQGAYALPGIRHEAVESTFLAIAVFSGCVYFGAIGRPLRLPKVIDNARRMELNADTYFALSIIAFVLAFLKFAIPSEFDFVAMFAALGGGRFSAPWVRGQLGGWNAFTDHLEYFGYMLPTLTTVIASRTSWWDRRTVLSGLFSILIMAFILQGGNRRILGVCIGSAIVAYILLNRKRDARSLAIAAVSAIALLAVLQLMLEYRNKGLMELFDSDTKARHFDYLHVDDNFVRVSQLMSIIPDKHPHVGTKWVVWVVARPIPRVFWRGKPIDPGFDLAKYLGERGVALVITTIGEVYMAFGWIGLVVGGLLMGKLAQSWSTIIETHTTAGGALLYGLGTMVFFAGMRSGIELVLMSYAILAWLVLLQLFKLRRPVVAGSSGKLDRISRSR